MLCGSAYAVSPSRFLVLGAGPFVDAAISVGGPPLYTCAEHWHCAAAMLARWPSLRVQDVPLGPRVPIATHRCGGACVDRLCGVRTRLWGRWCPLPMAAVLAVRHLSVGLEMPLGPLVPAYLGPCMAAPALWGVGLGLWCRC